MKQRCATVFGKPSPRLPTRSRFWRSWSHPIIARLIPKSPTRVRAILFAALAYFVLPLDTIPDFLVGFGFTDDMAVLGAVIASIRGNIKPRHTELARTKLAELANMKDEDSDAAA